MKKFYLFLFFLFLYFFLGIWLTYANDIIINVPWDLVYNLDSGRVLSSNSFPFDKWGTGFDKHPFTIIFVIPIIHLFNNLFNSTILGLLFTQAVFASLSVCVVNSILSLISDKTKINFLLTLIYGFSYTMLIFSSLPEDYIYMAFFVALNLFYVIKLFIDETLSRLNFKQIFILTFLLFLCFSVNFIYFLVNFIIIIFLLISIYKKNTLKIFFDFLKIFSLFIFFVFCFSILHFYVYKHTSIFLFIFDKTLLSNVFEFHKSELLQERYFSEIQILKFFLREFLVDPFYSLTSSKLPALWLPLKQWWDFVEKQNFILLIPIIVLFLSSIIYFIKNYKKYSYKNLILLIFILLLFFAILYYMYLPRYCFLYSANHFIYIVFLLGILMSQCTNGFFIFLCSSFLVFQIVNNFYNLHLLQDFLRSLSSEIFDMAIIMQKTFIIFIWIILFLFLFNRYVQIDKLKEKISSVKFDNKFLIGIVLYLCFIILYNFYFIIIRM